MRWLYDDTQNFEFLKQKGIKFIIDRFENDAKNYREFLEEFPDLYLGNIKSEQILFSELVKEKFDEIEIDHYNWSTASSYSLTGRTAISFLTRRNGYKIYAPAFQIEMGIYSSFKELFLDNGFPPDANNTIEKMKIKEYLDLNSYFIKI